MVLRSHRKIRVIILRCLPFAIFAGLQGCATALPELPSTDVPQNWQSEQSQESPSNIEWPEVNWWAQFNSTELITLLDEVRLYNFDLANNRRNLDIAQLTLKNAGIDLWPTPSVSIAANSQYTNIEGDGISGNSSETATAAATLSYTDILSKPTNYDQAKATYSSSLANAVDTALSTFCTAANAYFQYLLIQDQITAATQNLTNASEILAIAEAKANAGTTTRIDVLQQRIAVEQQRNTLKNLDQNALSIRASLALLTGVNLRKLQLLGDTLNQVDTPEIHSGVPSDLLTRRPDIVQAEAQLRSARADVDLARLAYLPKISLTAGGYATSTSLSALLNSPAKSVEATASLVQSVLDNGSRRRATKQSRLLLENALSNYRKTVIGAFNEVEVTLGNLALRQSQEHVAKEDLERAEESFRIAQVRYRAGADDYQTMISTQNTLFDVRTTYLQNKYNRLTSLISLYQALGGGWQGEQDTMTTDALISQTSNTP
ncbi:Outer membrane protein OprM [Thalassocella blandensis]|nr:Outer membrane protein OprM [Thalassocella blandensis]